MSTNSSKIALINSAAIKAKTQRASPAVPRGENIQQTAEDYDSEEKKENEREMRERRCE